MFRMSPLALAAIGLVGCAPTPPAYLAAAADPNSTVPPIAIPRLTADMRHFDIVEPKGWDDLNRIVTPKGGSHVP